MRERPGGWDHKRSRSPPIAYSFRNKARCHTPRGLRHAAAPSSPLHRRHLEEVRRRISISSGDRSYSIGQGIGILSGAEGGSSTDLAAPCQRRECLGEFASSWPSAGNHYVRCERSGFQREGPHHGQQESVHHREPLWRPLDYEQAAWFFHSGVAPFIRLPGVLLPGRFV